MNGDRRQCEMCKLTFVEDYPDNFDATPETDRFCSPECMRELKARKQYDRAWLEYLEK